MDEISDELDFVFPLSQDDADYVLRALPGNGDVIDRTDGTRLRIIFHVNNSTHVVASSNYGKGVSVALYDNAENAVLSSRPSALEEIAYDYVSSCEGDFSRDGWIAVSMCKSDNSIFTNNDKTEALNSLDLTITYKDSGSKKLRTIEKNVAQNTESIVEITNNLAYISNISLTITNGYQVRCKDGALIPSTDYHYCDYVPVKESETYITTCVLGGAYKDDNFVGVVGYNENYEYVCEILNQRIAIGEDGGRHLIKDGEFIIPSGVSFIRACSAYKNTVPGHSEYPYIDLSISKVNTKSLENRVNILEKKIDTHILESLSEYNTFKNGDASASLGYKKNFTISVCSDLHGAAGQWRDFINYSNSYGEFIDCSVFLGDICGQNPNSDISFYRPSDFNKTFLPVVGNHDVADYGSIAISQTDIFTRYIKPCVDEGFISTSKSYYYKDFTDYEIRIITLMEYENAVSTESANSDHYRRYISTEQLQWFADTLYDTPANYSVLVLLHQIVDNNPNIVDCKFTENSIYRQVNAAFTNGFGYQLDNMIGNPIGDIVDAFMNSKSINKTYKTQLTSSQLTSAVSKDFSGKDNGKFICYLSGHTHAPFVLKDGTYNKQIQILLPSASDSIYQRKADDIRPIAKEENFYCMAFDTVNKLIKIMKVGNKVTMDMLERNHVSIPY